MGIKERQERDREVVRRAILDAARELFLRDGFDQVSLRKIAERIEYSPAAIYSYFTSKDDIFFSLAEEGFRLLEGDQETHTALAALPPLSRIRALFWRLYEFSCEHPQYFALMFVDRSMPRISREYERFAFAREGKQRLLAWVREAVEAGALPRTASPDVMLQLVASAVIGVAVLQLSGRLPSRAVSDNLASDMLDVTLAGLATAPSLRTATLCADEANAADCDSRLS
jgi:AcrR family transcriptional regulator